MAATGTQHIAQLAKSGRSTCKKCNQKIDDKTLRLGKAYDNGERMMTHWYHPHCWPVPKALVSLADIDGWDSLAEEHKQLIIARAPNRAPAPAAPTTTLSDFVALCEQLEAEGGVGGGSTLEKSAIISRHFQKLTHPSDRFLTARLLMPSKKEHDDRVYNLKDKTLVAHLSSVLGCDEGAMAADLETSEDIGITAEKFLTSSPVRAASAPPPMPIAQINDWLDQLAQASAPTASLLRDIVPKVTPSQLKIVIRFVRKDLRIGCGAAVVLKGIGGDGAWERFKARPHELEAICQLPNTARPGGGDGGSGARDGGGAGSSSSTAGPSAGAGGSSDGSLTAGQPCRPQLAGQCGSFDMPVTKYPSGFFVEVKYDGERLQAHMTSDGKVDFYSRALKTPPATKTAGLADALRAAFPSDSASSSPPREIVLDGEVVMRAADGSVLAFGAQGVHEQKKHKDATCCLLVFDVLVFDGVDVTSKPLRARRAMLEASMVTQPRRVELSSCRRMSTAAEVAAAFKEAELASLEGLMLKDVEGRYVPGDRKLWLKVKKDYLGEKDCDAAGCAMADSVDLVVLGAFFGTGNKSALLSSFLMGCYDGDADTWQIVCKLANGFSIARLEQLTEALSTGPSALMTRLNADASLPSWLPVAAKGALRPTFVLKTAPVDDSGNLVFEVKGAEFTTGSKNSGVSVSIRFPRLVRERDDKDVSDATTAGHLADLVALSGGPKVVSLPSLSAGAATTSAATGTSTGGASSSNSGTTANAVAVAASSAANAMDDDTEDDDDDTSGRQPPAPLPRPAAGKQKAEPAAPPPQPPRAAAGGWPDRRPLCKYGPACYRKNPEHRAEFRHDEPAPSANPVHDKARAGKGGAPRRGGGNAATGKRKRAAKSEDEEDSEDDDGFVVADEDDDEEGSGGIPEPAQVLSSRLRAKQPVKYTNGDDDASESHSEDGDGGDDDEDGDDDGGSAYRNDARMREALDAATDEDEAMAVDEEGAAAADIGAGAGAGSAIVAAGDAVAAALEAETEDSDQTDEDEPPAPPPAVTTAAAVATAAGAASSSVAPPPAAAAPAASTTPPPPPGRWEVLLGRKFQPYPSNVSAAIEVAWRCDDDEVEVEVRGVEYVIRLKGDLVQEVKGDPSRWRSVRRYVARD